MIRSTLNDSIRRIASWILDWIELNWSELLFFASLICLHIAVFCLFGVVLGYYVAGFDGFARVIAFRGLFISVYAENIAIYSAFYSTTTTTVLTNSTLPLDTKDNSTTYSSLRTETVPTLRLFASILLVAHTTTLPFIPATHLLTNFPGAQSLRNCPPESISPSY